MRWERVVEASLMADVTVNDLQYGFMQKQMQFALRELMENHREGLKESHCGSRESVMIWLCGRQEWTQTQTHGNGT